MDEIDKPLSFAEDDSKNPPPKRFLDRLTRRYSRPVYAIVVLLLYVLASTALGLALAPALWISTHVFIWSQSLPSFLHWIVLGFGIALSFFVFGFALLIIVPMYNWLLPTRVKPFKGGYYSLKAVPWFIHNGLFYLVSVELVRQQPSDSSTGVTIDATTAPLESSNNSGGFTSSANEKWTTNSALFLMGGMLANYYL